MSTVVKDTAKESLGSVESWRKFSQVMEKYITQCTGIKYVTTSDGFEFIDIASAEFTLDNIIKYAMRIKNGKIKSINDILKIAHYVSFFYFKYMKNLAKNEGNDDITKFIIDEAGKRYDVEHHPDDDLIEDVIKRSVAEHEAYLRKQKEQEEKERKEFNYSKLCKSCKIKQCEDKGYCNLCRAAGYDYQLINDLLNNFGDHLKKQEEKEDRREDKTYDRTIVVDHDSLTECEKTAKVLSTEYKKVD